MIVCHCHAVSDREVLACAQRGATDVADVSAECRAGSDCHGCHARIWELLDTVSPAVVTLRAS